MSPENDRRQGDADLALLLFRVSAVEQGIKEVRQDLKTSFEKLEAAIAALMFVPMTLYVSEQKGIRKDIEDMGADINDARKIALGALGMISSAVIGAIIFAIIGSLK